MRRHNNLFKATNNIEIFHAFFNGPYEPEESNTLSVKTDKLLMLTNN